MAPEALNDLLNAVAPSRRGFLKTILTGTAFAAPLMASFSMDGLSVDAAAAATCGNMTTVHPFLADPFSCSNMTVPRRAPMFKAKLKDSHNHQRGTVMFELDVKKCHVEYRLTLTGRLETVNFGPVGVPAAVLVISSPHAEYVLTAGRGQIGVALPCLPTITDLVDAFNNGQAEVFVLTDMYDAHGVVAPS